MPTRLSKEHAFCENYDGLMYTHGARRSFYRACKSYLLTSLNDYRWLLSIYDSLSNAKYPLPIADACVVRLRRGEAHCKNIVKNEPEGCII